MRRKEDLIGLYNVYTVYDKVSKRYRGTFYHTTDEDMIRITLPSILLDFPLRDIEVYRIGTFNDVTGELGKATRKRINTRCYLFPHSRLSSDGDNITHEELEKKMQEKKVSMIVNHGDNRDEDTQKEVVNE